MTTLILVDDDSDDVYFVKQACKSVERNVEFITFSDGSAAVQFFEQGNYPPGSIVLLDLNMPILNGLEVLKKIRNELGDIFIPIIVYTTSKNTKDIGDCYRNGANSYIKKLDNMKELNKFINSLVTYWADYNRTA